MGQARMGMAMATTRATATADPTTIATGTRDLFFNVVTLATYKGPLKQPSQHSVSTLISLIPRNLFLKIRMAKMILGGSREWKRNKENGKWKMENGKWKKLAEAWYIG